MNITRLKKGERREVNWDCLIMDLLDNCELYHNYFYKYNQFTGPSIYFHLRALTADNISKPEMTYALLVSWGMHRMGGGAQMNDYETFCNSISACSHTFQLLKGKKLSDISESDFDILLHIFDNLNPMRSSKKIVGVSKVMAHYLPDIIAPIDNEYTFKFICGKPSAPINWTEKDIFKNIHLKLFKPIVSDRKFIGLTTKWLGNKEFPWDTSLPKIVDNLIIGKIGHLKRTVPDFNMTKI